MDAGSDQPLKARAKDSYMSYGLNLGCDPKPQTRNPSHGLNLGCGGPIWGCIGFWGGPMKGHTTNLVQGSYDSLAMNSVYVNHILWILEVPFTNDRYSGPSSKYPIIISPKAWAIITSTKTPSKPQTYWAHGPLG